MTWMSGRLILRAALSLQETGNDPITQEPLDLDDLIPVKTNKAVKPRPAPATSIPGLLGLFHNVRLQLANAGHAKQACCNAQLLSSTFYPPVFSATGVSCM